MLCIKVVSLIQANWLEVIMIAAAEIAALGLKDFPSTKHICQEIDNRNQVVRLLDKNKYGEISIEELMEVMEELGAYGDDAREMMQLLNSNSDGFLAQMNLICFRSRLKSCKI